MTSRLTTTRPVSWLTSTSATIAQYPLSPSYSTHEMPRPAATPPVRRIAGARRRPRLPVRGLRRCLHDVDQPGIAQMTKPVRRPDPPSPTAAISSMNDSCAKVFCSREGERSGPVKNGDWNVVRQHALAGDGAGASAPAADACRSRTREPRCCRWRNSPDPALAFSARTRPARSPPGSR